MRSEKLIPEASAEASAVSKARRLPMPVSGSVAASASSSATRLSKLAVSEVSREVERSWSATIWTT